MKAKLELHLVILHPERSRNRRVREQIRDNMKLFRAYECEVFIWLDRSLDVCSRIKKEENHSCSVQPLQYLPPFKRLPVSREEESMNLLQGDEILESHIPDSSDMSFDLLRFVTVATRS